MTNSVDPDQTAAIGSGSTLFASIHELVSNVRQLFAADDFSRRHFFSCIFLGAFSANVQPKHLMQPYPLQYLIIMHQ